MAWAFATPKQSDEELFAAVGQWRSAWANSMCRRSPTQHGRVQCQSSLVSSYTKVGKGSGAACA